MARKDDLLRFVLVCTSAKGLKVWEKILGNGGEAGFGGVYPKAFLFFFFFFFFMWFAWLSVTTNPPLTLEMEEGREL